jgi:Glycosyltransferase Family 4
LRVLLTNTMLDLRAGSELYLLDLVRHLKGRNFTLAAFSTRLGGVAEELRREGVEVVDRLESLRAAPDLIHGQHHLETMMALLHFPGVPALFVCHGALPWEEMPPRFPRIRRYVAVDDATHKRLRADGEIASDRIVQILNFVDLDRFQPRAPPPPRPARALALSNRASETTFLPALRSACASRGISLDVAGLDSGHPTASPETLLPHYDLVFAKGRSALEALAVGCAVVVCDATGLGKLVTPKTYEQLRPLNFGFLTLDRPHDPALIGAEIDRYDSGEAQRMSVRVRAEAGIETAVDRYCELYAQILREARAVPADGADERRATVAYLRRVRETYWTPAPSAELETLRRSLAFRIRQQILERPRLQRLYAWLRRR